jgi:hypothetical protein
MFYICVATANLSFVKEQNGPSVGRRQLCGQIALDPRSEAPIGCLRLSNQLHGTLMNRLQ